MKCSEVNAFLSQINAQQPITPVPAADLDFLVANGYVQITTEADHDQIADEVARLSQVADQTEVEADLETQTNESLQKDEHTEHSFMFHFKGGEEKEELSQRVQQETESLSQQQSNLNALEASVAQLVQKKSQLGRMAPYGGGYISLTDVGFLVMDDLAVRNYRFADEEFSDFLTELRATYAELRSIAERASWYVGVIKPVIQGPDDDDDEGQEPPFVGVQSLAWSAAIGLAKLQGDPQQLAQRYLEALTFLRNLKHTPTSKLMAAEIMTSITSQDVRSLEPQLLDLEKQMRDIGVPQELSIGIAATLMAGRRYDGTYPTDNFPFFKRMTSSYEAAAILSVMNVPDELASKFQSFRSTFTSWGYTTSEDTEIASAFLAIGDLNVEDIQDKLKYIVEQLHNYLEYPLVAGAILASIPVFEAHEVLDLMEKAVTLLTSCAAGLERSELVTLAVRMIHGVRNELVKELDPTARVAQTPVQFSYAPNPGFIWFYPLIVANSSYHATFSAMGGFHPAHSHGIGGFAG